MQEVLINEFWDHLHIRGEYLPIDYIMTSEVGITSTYVENTPEISSAVSANEDHLHIRGEYQNTSKKKFSKLGSPPHTWRILILLSYEVH